MKKFNLIGQNTGGSLSPYIHNFIFDKIGIDAKYKAINLRSTSNIKEIIDKLKLGILTGVNITNPYKIDAI